jgi:hypothetical protein
MALGFSCGAMLLEQILSFSKVRLQEIIRDSTKFLTTMAIASLSLGAPVSKLESRQKSSSRIQTGSALNLDPRLID